MFLLYPNIYVKSSVIIFGGSFSPITIAHINLILNTMRYCFDSKLIIVPIKKSSSKSLLDFQHRCQMCRLSIEHIKQLHPNYDIELREDCEVMNAEYIQQFEQMNKQVCYLCGYNVYQNFHTWEKIDRDLFFTKYNLIVYPRNDEISSTKVRAGNLNYCIKSIADYLTSFGLLAS